MGAEHDESSFHVLAVDDSLIDRKLIERLLRTSSYRVTTVDSGSKALEFLGLREDDEEEEEAVTDDSDAPTVSPTSHREVEVNLIITDYCMPGMTGYDLLKKIKESSALRNIPVVIMSSENVPSRITECLEEGAEEFFLKPVRLSDLHRLRPLMKSRANDNDCKKDGAENYDPQPRESRVQSHRQNHQPTQLQLQQQQQKSSDNSNNSNKRKGAAIEEGLSPDRTRHIYRGCPKSHRAMSTINMNQKEVVDTLLVKAKIEPGFTELVWQKLEAENREFFKSYYLRLIVKHQITEFNKLLEQQVQLIRQMHPGSVPTLPNANGTRASPLQPNSTCYAADYSGRGVGATGIPGTFTNGGAALPASLQASIEILAHLNRIDATSNMLHNHSPNMGLIPGMNGGSMIKNEASYSGDSYIFGAGGDVLDARPSIGAPSVPSFSSVDSTPLPINEALLDAGSGSFDLLSSIPRSFSLSDLTADFSQSSDILEYPRSPFSGLDMEHLLESCDRGEQGDNRRLNPITENLSYNNFGID